MNLKENKIVYNPKELSVKMLKDVLKSFYEQKAPRETIRYVGRRQLEIEKLMLSNKQEDKTRLQEIYEEIDREMKASHCKSAEMFIEKYGQILYAFCDNISKDNYFLSNKDGNYLWWDAIETGEADEDDYFRVVLEKGVFSYIKDLCGGYAGKEILETNITTERVLELLKK